MFQETLLAEYDLYKNTTYEKRYKLETQLAILYSRLNDKDLALYYFDKLWKHYNKKKDYYNMAQTKTNIGNTYLNFDETEKSLAYFFEALKLQEKVPKDNLKIIINTNIGRAYTKLHENAKALQFLSESEKLIIDKTPIETKAWIYTCLAQLYMQTKDP